MRFINLLLDKIEEYAIVLLMLAITLVTFSNVVARISGANILWAKELTQHLFAWLVIFGAAYAVRVGAHIGVDAFVKRLSPQLQRHVGLFAVLVALTYAGILLYGGSLAFHEEYALNIEMEDMPIKEWIAKLVLPLGFALFTYRLLQLLWSVIKGDSKGFSMADEAQDALDDFESNNDTNDKAAEQQSK